jgi:hypothetical protein
MGWMGKSKTLTAIFFIVGLLMTTTAVHGMDADALKPLLIDLPNWQAGEPQGSSLDLETHMVISAARSYVAEGRKFTVKVAVADGAISAGPVSEGVVETRESVARSQKIDGFQVFTSFEKAIEEGTVVVTLDQSRQMVSELTLSFIGLTEAQALDMARSFDWVRMRAMCRTLY